jgi:hypothetical protein
VIFEDYLGIFQVSKLGEGIQGKEGRKERKSEEGEYITSEFTQIL